MTYKLTGPTFAFCGTFSGKDASGISAARWLKKFEHEMSGYKSENDGTIPAQTYLDSLSMLLTDDAAEWSESHPDAIRLLAETSPNPQTVDSFKSLFCERFPSKAVEVTPVPFDVELSDLRQKPDEPLATYYKRITNLMQRVGAKDRPAASSGTTLTLLESAMLDTILRAFIRGLIDTNVRKEATRGMASSDRSLKVIYNLAEEARRTNIEVQKLFEEEVKHDELVFYKQLALANMAKPQIDALLTSYHTAKASSPNGQIPQNWNQNPPPSYDASSNSRHQSSDRPPAPPRDRDNRDNRASARNNPAPKDLPERATSKNPWINGTLIWSYDKDGRLCVSCGTKGHISKDCTNAALPAWERSYLRMIVFGDPPQANFASAGYGSYDGNSQAYGTPSDADRLASLSTSSSIDTYVDLSPRSHSLSFGLAGLRMDRSSESKVAVANYGEGSGPNKRPHFQEEPAPVQQPPQQPAFPQQLPFQFQAADERPKVKGKKRVGKKAEPQPLIGMFNDSLGRYDSPVSIRQLLQNNKVDISWMDLVAWSPAVCKEMKRLCTRVAKKRTAKPKAPLGFQQFQPSVQQQQAPQMPATLPQQAFQQPATFPPFQQVPQKFPPQPAPQPAAQPTLYQYVPAPPQQAPQPIVAPDLAPQQQLSQDTLSTSTALSKVLSVEAEKHTRFLSNLVGVDKAFRIPATVKLEDGELVDIEKRYVQGDQGSDMNVISADLVQRLRLTLHRVEEVGFKGLSMRTADQKDTLLHHWVWLSIIVEGVQRDIRCFVSPRVISKNESGQIEQLSLILGLPWLYSVDARISIRQSEIMIGDKDIGENVRAVQGPQLVFCKEHNLLMYPKSILAVPRPKAAGRVVEVATEDEDESESSDDSESEDDLSDVEDSQVFR